MRPLEGRRILVTRPADRAGPFCERLESLGAVAVRMPAIDVRAAPADDASDAVLLSLDSFDWVIFTSPNGVRHGLARLNRLGLGPRDFREVRTAAVGPATAAALRSAGIEVAAVPDRHTAESIADVVGSIGGCRFLLLRGDIATPTLPARLRASGGEVSEIVVYVTSVLAAPEAVRLDDIDAITLTSASTARGLLERADHGIPERVAIVTIGPVTSAEVRAAGVGVDVEADPHTMDGLVDALVRYFEDRSRTMEPEA